MTPDEGLQHEWILEGNFNRTRQRTRPTMRKASDSSISTDRQTNSKTCESAFYFIMHIICLCKLCICCFIGFNIFCFYGTAEKVSSQSNSNDKLKRDSSETGTKMAERLRPIGASAEEEMCESEGKISTDTKQQEGGGERPVHIIIKPQEGRERNDSQEPSQYLPPII